MSLEMKIKCKINVWLLLGDYGPPYTRQEYPTPRPTPVQSDIYIRLFSS